MEATKRMQVTGALALCVLAALHSSRPIEPVPYFFGALAFNAVFATGLAWLLWLYVLQHLSTGMAGLSALGVPMIGVLAGWLELGEQPSAAESAGMLLIGGALALISLWSLRQSRQHSRRPGRQAAALAGGRQGAAASQPCKVRTGD